MTIILDLAEKNKLFRFDAFIEVLESTNSHNVNKSGNLVNVSKNMIYLKEQSTDRIVKIAKKEITIFRIYDHIVNGKLPGKRLLGRPEEVIV